MACGKERGDGRSMKMHALEGYWYQEASPELVLDRTPHSATLELPSRKTANLFACGLLVNGRQI